MYQSFIFLAFHCLLVWLTNIPLSAFLSGGLEGTKTAFFFSRVFEESYFLDLFSTEQRGLLQAIPSPRVGLILPFWRQEFAPFILIK